jgi:predicted acetyltransferase
MQGPRSPEAHELKKLVDFLNDNLRENQSWPITSEYPTALSASNIHNMSIITEDEKIISHAVLKTLIVKTPYAIFKIGAIGSVVTAPEYRQQGYSRKNIENCIELAHKQDCDLVILWTDQFEFYRKFGFELAGYDNSYIVDAALPIQDKTLRFVTGNNVAPEALQKIYSMHTVQAVRNTEDFRQFLKIPNSNLYTAWSPQNQLMAYAVEGKGMDLVNYVHEWGGQVDALADLLNYIYAQKQSPVTIMTPHHSQNLHKKLESQNLFKHEGYLGMLKFINLDQLLTKIKKAFRAEGHENVVLEKQGESFILGFGTDLYTLQSEADLMQLLFGPLDISALSFMTTEAQEKFARLLPMPLWIWGWDSI